MVVLNSLPPVITVVVHEVNTEAHPTVPPGWRWAVQVGGGPPSDLDACANAGWEPSQQLAALAGEAVGAAAAKALRLCGLPARYAVLTLDHDPIPAGADRISIG